MGTKQRIDHRVVDEALAQDLKTARALIMAGKVLVNDVPVTKAGTLVKEQDTLRLKSGKRPPGMVSRGGQKLGAAFSHFDFDVTDRVCADIGASTGGFTQSLLNHGATQVLAIDSASGELASSLINDSRVTVLDSTPVSTLPALKESLQPTFDRVTVAVGDVSLVPLSSILPHCLEAFTSLESMVFLFKPHYEQSAAQGRANDATLDSSAHRDLLIRFTSWWATQHPDWAVTQLIASPITGNARSKTRGNREFLLHFKKNAEALSQEALQALIEAVVTQ